jgi:hypothetical protein
MTVRRGGVRVPPQLELCRGCHQFIYPDAELCHFCGVDVKAVNAAYHAKLLEARKAAFEVDLILRRMQREMERKNRSTSEAQRDIRSEG